MAKSAITRAQLRKAGGFTIDSGEYNKIIDNINSRLDRTTAIALKSDFMEAGKILRDKTKAEAPFDPKRKKGFHLREAIFVAPGKSDQANVLVGVSRSRRQTGKPSAPHGVPVHGGTKDRITKKGHRTGRVEANPFMSRAIAETRGTIAAKLISSLQKAALGDIK